jgi:hypothetical protein
MVSLTSVGSSVCSSGPNGVITPDQKWLGTRLGRRDCPQTQESVGWDSDKFPPVCWGMDRMVENKLNTHTGCVYYCRTYYNAVCGGGRGTVKDMYYEVRPAEACVD